jgi:hypothetical protein
MVSAMSTQPDFERALKIIFDMEGDVCRAKDLAYVVYDRVMERGEIAEEMHGALVILTGELLDAARKVKEAYYRPFEATQRSPSLERKLSCIGKTWRH